MQESTKRIKKRNKNLSKLQNMFNGTVQLISKRNKEQNQTFIIMKRF
jgi:hypothetical protein